MLKALASLVLAGALGVSAAQTPASSAAAQPLHVSVPEKVQRASGIVTVVLPAVRFHPEAEAVARVIDPGPLLTLRARFQAAQAAVEMSRNVYQRQEKLYAVKATSKKNLQASYAAWQADRGTLRVLQAQASAQWGVTLGRRLASGQAPVLDALAAGTTSLLQVTLPLASANVQPPPRISLRDGLRARRLSPAPSVAAEIQAPSWFYSTSAFVRAGLRLVAGIPLDVPPRIGVIVPESAVIWYGGRAWVYVRQSDTGFERRAIATDAPATHGWFVDQNNLHPGVRIAEQGAELLFAEEFKASVPQGDADD